MIEASIVILTYRRPHGLTAALASCRAQVGVDAPTEIIVVDNDGAGSAAAIVAAAAGCGPYPIRYLHEPQPGIAQARNAGVKAATGRFLLFLDDDEEAVPGWLAAFLATMRRTDADIAVGPVFPRFPPDAAVVDGYTRRVFTRDAGVASGTPLPRWSGIGNSILRSERCFAEPDPFDPGLALAGGEDALFLGRLRRDGRELVWCAEAAVTESVPADRLAPSYLLRRAFRGGQITTFVHAAVTPPEPVAVLRWMAIGCAQSACFGPIGFTLRLLRRPQWLPVLAKAASGLGKVFWPRRLQLSLYRREAGSGIT
jgi:succinoglycan biosynthesis protein ExoM